MLEIGNDHEHDREGVQAIYFAGGPPFVPAFNEESHYVESLVEQGIGPQKLRIVQVENLVR